MTGYERVKQGKFYFVERGAEIDNREACISIEETNHFADNGYYKTANYYSDEIVAKNNARADKLMRQLRRFAVEHNEGEIDWGNVIQSKWYIEYDFDGEELFVSWDTCIRSFGQIYFTSEEIAKQAREEFKDELLWYFTEYTDHIVEDNKKVELECELCENPEKLQAMQTLRFKYCPKCGKEFKKQ